MLNPHEWGWKSTKNGLLPIPTTQPPAPPSLLEQIACKCSKGCQGKCGCRKLGIKCSIFCNECAGINCENANIPEICEEDIIEDVDDELDIAFDVE